MKSILATIAICWTLLAGWWWHVKSSPAYLAARQPVAAPCPANSTLRGDTCVCHTGTRLHGAACLQVWTSTSSRVMREYLGIAPHADNCVFIARKRVPSLPYGLSTWTGKLKAINSHTPKPGSVAMI